MALDVDVAVAELHASVERYYRGKIETFGATPYGVDWSCAPTQELRFVQLLRIGDFSRPHSLNDLGCGYGALFGFLKRRHPGVPVDYLGIDLCDAMVTQARSLWRHREKPQFQLGSTSTRSADYSVASGIFNVKLHYSIDEWTSLIRSTLRQIRATSRLGFAVNFLAALQTQQGAPELFRTSPLQWQEFLEKDLGVNVQVMAGYGMREFTLLARI